MFKPFFLTALTAILVVLSFAHWDQHYLIWVALIPWFYAIELTQTGKQRFKLGFLFSFLMTAGGFYWIVYSIHNFAPMPWIPAALLGSIFFVIGQPQFYILSPLFGWVFRNHKRPWTLPLLLAGIYTSIDYITPRLFLDGLGYSLVSNLWASQWAAYGGMPLLTFLIVTVNGFFYVGLRSLDQKNRTLMLGTGLALISVIHIVGYIELAATEQTLTTSPASKIKFAVIQANIGDAQKLASERGFVEASDEVIGSYLYMSGLAATQTPQPDVIVWPETAYPLAWERSLSPHELSREQQIKDMVNQSKIPLLFGGYDNDRKYDYNTLFYLEPGKKAVDYHKTILLPFAEYVPGFENWQWFRSQFPQMGFFGRGPGAVSIETNTGNLKFRTGPLICYEGLFPSFTRAQKKAGAQILLNVTNDSWFGPYGEPYLHLALTRLRAIETRMPLLRATNTGITTLIEPSGVMVSPSAVGTSLIANYSVSTHEFAPTLYVQFGDYWLILVSLLTLVTLLRMRLKSKH